MAEHVPTTVEGAIPNLLMTRLGTLPGHSPALGMAFPGLAYEPTDQPYFDVAHLPNVTLSPFVSGDSKRLRGIHQVTVVYPTGAGIVPAYDLAGEIVDHFKKGTVILGTVDGEPVKVQIISAPWAAGHLIDGTWIRVPVTIPFLCETRDA
jgi:hypothetical protein